MPRPNDAPASAKTAILNSWEAATFPTWTFWGRTTVHTYNTGNSGVTASFQAGAAQPAYAYVDQGEDHREYGFWGGFPVTITCATQRDDPNGVAPQLEVWVW
jgi:hypothetical protein